MENVAASNASQAFCRNYYSFLIISNNAVTEPVCFKKGLENNAKHIQFATKVRTGNSVSSDPKK